MPDWSEEIRAALAGLNLNPAQEASVADELAQHLEDRYEEMRRDGLDDAEASRLLRSELNDGRLVTELKGLLPPVPEAISPGQDIRERLLAGLGKDLRYAIRMLRLNPSFAAVAILSLALGIGANTAIFELLDAVVLRTLPVQSPQQLASIREIHGGRIGSTVARQKNFSYALWQQIQQQQKGFSGIAAWSTETFDLGQGGEAHYVQGMWVSGSFFRTLGIRPVLGRLLTENDDYRGCGLRAVVISYAFWQRSFAGRADAVGSKLSLDGHPFEVIGITPASFYGLEIGRNFDVAVPVCSESAIRTEGSWTQSATTWWLDVIGRLSAGWTLGKANAQLASMAPGIFAATLPPEYDATERKDYLRFRLKAETAATGVSELRAQYADPLRALLAISGLVLLLACTNLANLMLARAAARQREIALRLALGASRRRLIRQLFTENVFLALVGAAVGLILAQILGSVLVAFIGNSENPAFLPLYPNMRVLLFTIGIASLTCLFFGVAPAIRIGRVEPGTVMKTNGRGLTGRQHFLLRRGLVVSQVALSLVLVVAALLFVQTFRNLVTLNPGFRQDGVLVADFDFSALHILPQNRTDYKRELLSNVRNTPGVVSAAEAAIVPLNGDGWNEFIDIPEQGVSRKLVYFNAVSSGYFQTLQIPFLAGRDFDDGDIASSPPVAIVNEHFAHTYLGSTDPIGKTFRVRQDGGKPDRIFHVVGLAGDTRYRDIHDEPTPIVFVSPYQRPIADTDSTFLVRSNEAPASLILSLKDTAAKNSPEIVLNFSILRMSVLEKLTRERLMATLSGVYGALATVLAMVGIYGIISFMVIRRSGEMGLRIALGAQRTRVVGIVLREAAALVAGGLVVGTAVAIACARTVRTLLYGIKPIDPLTLIIAIVGLLTIALAASLLPAIRAASVDPIQALREE
ncbi:MAG TPA: ABC transporter permease [Candidatus Polarisedimenticolia bacterium]|nr:ABC transporter permease [Candidatus Polarisedimenticolia bacterium]